MRFKISAAATTAIAAALLVGACNKQKSVSLQNASMDQVAATQSNTIKPGAWEVTAEISTESAGGANALGALKVPPSTSRICITPEQAAKPDAVFGKGFDQFKQNCTYDKYEMSGGKLTSQMHCDLQGGLKVKASSNGTFSDTEFTSDGTSEVMMPGGMVTTSHTKVSAHRVGDCTASDPVAGPTPALGAPAGGGATAGAGASVTP